MMYLSSLTGDMVADTQIVVIIQTQYDELVYEISHIPLDLLR